MEKIVVLGTSNSIMGRNGYIKALRAQYEVINLSVGRCPVHRHISALLEHKDTIATADLLVLEHYVNDISFYADFFDEAQRFDEYIRHIEDFYQLVAAQNLRVLNVLFPLQPQEFASAPAQAYLARIKALNLQYGFHVVDLTALSLEAGHFKDTVHVTPAVSYLIGLGLLLELPNLLSQPHPIGGQIKHTPYRRIAATDLFPEGGLESFRNSLISLKYKPLQTALKLKLEGQEELIAVGYFCPWDQEQPQGITLGWQKYFLDGYGYFMESLPNHRKGAIKISPLSGRATNIPSLMGRQDSGPKQGFAPPNFVDALVYDPTHPLNATAAVRAGGPVSVALMQLSLETIALPEIEPNVVNALRDLAIRSEERSLKLALGLMRLALIGRPDGPLIKNKIQAYEQQLELQKQKALPRP